MKRQTWADRALALDARLDGLVETAPPEIKLAVRNAIDHFVWAADCRRQANAPRHLRGDNVLPGWGAKADKAHYHGKKQYAIAKKWLDAQVTR